MFGRKKHKMRNYSVIISLILLFYSCNSNQEVGFELHGQTQGTTYTIIVAEDKLNFDQSEVTTLLADFDTILSTYIPESKISQLNESTNGYTFEDKHQFFKTCYELSLSVYNNTTGLFDPSVYNLINAWGFYKKIESFPEQQVIDSVLQFTSFEPGKFYSVQFNENSVHFQKNDSRFKLDFNAIAQGYSVDVLADFIEKRGHQNYYIEIGGEIRLKGKNRSGKKWQIGIDVPDELEEREAISTLSISDCGIATSGNYRNYQERNGKIYGHIVSPKTGYPIETAVLSATVIHKNAALADAYATVLLLLDQQEAIKYMQKNKLQGILIYLDLNKNYKIYQQFN